MSRLASTFNRIRAENRAAFVAYLCAGDPDFDTSLAACRALLQSKVDVLELGVPFSDPLADGLTNQLAAQRALDGGMTAVQRRRRTQEIVADNGTGAIRSPAERSGRRADRPRIGVVRCSAG